MQKLYQSGHAIWWNTMPMPVAGFLEHYDWNGKRIVPFVTSGGGGFGKSIEDMKKICVGAEILEGGEFLGHQVEEPEEAISGWAKNVAISS